MCPVLPANEYIIQLDRACVCAFYLAADEDTSPPIILFSLFCSTILISIDRRQFGGAEAKLFVIQRVAFRWNMEPIFRFIRFVKDAQTLPMAMFSWPGDDDHDHPKRKLIAYIRLDTTTVGRGSVLARQPIWLTAVMLITGVQRQRV